MLCLSTKTPYLFRFYLPTKHLQCFFNEWNVYIHDKWAQMNQNHCKPVVNVLLAKGRKALRTRWRRPKEMRRRGTEVWRWEGTPGVYVCWSKPRRKWVPIWGSMSKLSSHRSRHGDTWMTVGWKRWTMGRWGTVVGNWSRWPVGSWRWQSTRRWKSRGKVLVMWSRTRRIPDWRC